MPKTRANGGFDCELYPLLGKALKLTVTGRQGKPGGEPWPRVGLIKGIPMTTDKGEQNMTDEQINERCAVFIMRWIKIEKEWSSDTEDWSPATRIEQAFMLEHQLKFHGWNIDFNRIEDEYYCEFTRDKPINPYETKFESAGLKIDKDPARAICLAALAAVDGRE